VYKRDRWPRFQAGDEDLGFSRTRVVATRCRLCLRFHRLVVTIIPPRWGGKVTGVEIIPRTIIPRGERTGAPKWKRFCSSRCVHRSPLFFVSTSPPSPTPPPPPPAGGGGGGGGGVGGVVVFFFCVGSCV